MVVIMVILVINKKKKKNEKKKKNNNNNCYNNNIYIYPSIHPFQSHLKGTTGNDALQKSAAGPTGLWHGQAPHMAHKSLLSTMILIVYLKIILCL